MDITLFEKVDRNRLNEVLECGNLPFDGDETSEWKIAFITKLQNYSKKKLKNGKIPIKYNQPNKWGRYYSNNGYQSFKRDVRKYLNNENDKDIDIVNCHPILLQQIFKKYKIDCGDQLREYNKDRNSFVKKYELTDKLDMIKMFNNEILKNDLFKETHDLIYNDLLPKLIKDNKPVYDRIKKIQTKKGYNINGSFISSYLQEIENRILISMYKQLCSKGFTVSTLCFDGCLVEDCETLTDKTLRELESVIFKETKYKIKLIFKSMKTDWKPIKAEIIEGTIVKSWSETCQFSIETHNFLSQIKEENEEGILIIDEIKKQQFMEYSNKYMCKFEDPPCYGWRFNINNIYKMYERGVILDNINKTPFEIWKNSDDKLQYESSIFEVNEKLVTKCQYNKYVRPKMLSETTRTLQEISPLYYDFLKRVICDNDPNKLNYIINLNAKIFQKGQAQQAVVLQGEERCGKSSLVYTFIELNGREYSHTINHVNQLTKDFNSIFETKIITEVSEIVGNAGDFHSVANTFKDLIDNPYVRIEPKGVNAYMRKTMNNFFITGNGVNSFYVSENNQRVIIIEVKPHERANMKYFGDMKKEFLHNIEELRRFYYNFEHVDNLPLIRPITDEELVLVELNRSPIDLFIDTELKMSSKSMHISRLLNNQFNCFLQYCTDYKYKNTSMKYFSAQLKKRGFTTIKKGKKKDTYIVGNNDLEYQEEQHTPILIEI